MLPPSLSPVKGEFRRNSPTVSRRSQFLFASSRNSLEIIVTAEFSWTMPEQRFARSAEPHLAALVVGAANDVAARLSG